MNKQQTINAALKIMYEQSRETFQRNEQDLQLRLKNTGYIHGHVVCRILREMEDAGVPEVFANEYMQDRLYEMRKQIEEQRLQKVI